LSTFCVTILGVVSQARSTDEPFLSSSVSECDCLVNTTSIEHTASDILSMTNDDDDGFFAFFYRISYIYYSMIGTMLTVFFGLIISYLTDRRDRYRMTSLHETHEGGFRTPGHISVGSFLSDATQRRLSSFIHNVSQSTLKVENKLKEVISHSNLHHLHHLHVPGDDEERISILNEEDDQLEDGVAVKHSHMSTGKKKMFFIGHQDDREHDE
jgi:hypothetical protein